MKGLTVFTYWIAAADGRYMMWSVLLRLLQDEDEPVRHVAAQSVEVLTQHVSSLSLTGKYILRVIEVMVIARGGSYTPDEKYCYWVALKKNSHRPQCVKNSCCCTLAGN